MTVETRIDAAACLGTRFLSELGLVRGDHQRVASVHFFDVSEASFEIGAERTDVRY